MTSTPSMATAKSELSKGLMAQSDMRSILAGVTLAGFVFLTWFLAFTYAPVDANQGEVYRIMFLHVPSAFTAFSASLVIFLISIIGFKSRSEESLLWARATAEVGLLFTILTLATGSIWGKPTWGTWWTWDARLTTTFLLAILYAGYLLLYQSMNPGPARVKVCGALGILIFVDVPIIYKSVTWWRTLHQPPSMLREGGATMDSDILRTLLLAIIAMIGVGAWLISQRGKNLKLRYELETASMAQIRG
jgi:heme exporter protein C